MAKAKRGSKNNPLEPGELEAAALAATKRSFDVVEATLKDDFCNYSYQITDGVGVGNTHGVKGTHIVLDDMLNTFNRFNVHLAVLDDAFKLAEIDIDDINSLEGHEITLGYKVTGFKIKGNRENESITLTGTKHSDTAKGRFAISTPYIPIHGLSHYKWYNELKAVTDLTREEVALYHGGKYRIAEEDGDEDGKGKKRKVKQLTIASPEGAAETPEHLAGVGEDDSFDDFADAKR